MTPNTSIRGTTAMNQLDGAMEMHYLMNEALSRVRMHEPRREAYQSARYVAMRARRRQAREQGSY
jgi:ribosomal 50S subunit-associated protein YjgA (DUF615 family)